ncbi:MAG: hypothetical protein KGL10_04360, partial [Alphaproteobacteria bacterium]|nr:hypothetical protein [Alphaproteobacteria bacterium]
MAFGSRFVSRWKRNKTPAPADAPQQPAPDEQTFFTDEDGEELPGISGQGIGSIIADMQNAPETQVPPDLRDGEEATPEERLAAARRTAFHKIINEMWG